MRVEEVSQSSGQICRVAVLLERAILSGERRAVRGGGGAEQRGKQRGKQRGSRQGEGKREMHDCTCTRK